MRAPLSKPHISLVSEVQTKSLIDVPGKAPRRTRSPAQPSAGILSPFRSPRGYPSLSSGSGKRFSQITTLCSLHNIWAIQVESLVHTELTACTHTSTYGSELEFRTLCSFFRKHQTPVTFLPAPSTKPSLPQPEVSVGRRRRCVTIKCQRNCL